MGKDKIVLVTGGNSGIGQATAVRLANDGYTVLFTYRNEEGVDKTLEGIVDGSGKRKAYRCDITDVGQITDMVASVIDEYGKIDVLVNCAGISNTKPIEEIDETEWDLMINTNLKGTFFLMKEVFIAMKEQKHGKIITITSIAGQRGGFFSGAHYSASKGGLETLVKCFALRGAEYGITSNAISPGVVATPMAKEEGLSAEGIPIGRMAEPEEIAGAISFLAGEDSDYITGLTVDVNGGQLMR